MYITAQKRMQRRMFASSSQRVGFITMFMSSLKQAKLGTEERAFGLRMVLHSQYERSVTRLWAKKEPLGEVVRVVAGAFECKLV